MQAQCNNLKYMNRDRLQGICKQVGGELKIGWGRISNDSQAMAEGRRDRIAGKIQELRGISRQEAERQLEDFLRRNRNWSSPSKR
jgi:uncharacterized protein YjbJ (UPF0337 family)